MESQSSLKRRWIPYAVLLLISFLFFSPFFLQGKIFLAADTLYSFYPWKYYSPPNFQPHNMLITDPVNGSYPGLYNMELHAGGLSHWKPYIMNGLPSSSVTDMSGGPGRYNPIKLVLHRSFSPTTALMLSLFLHVLIMGLSMYLFLKEIGAGWRGALFGAVVYMFNGYAMVWLEFESVAVSSAFFPLILLVMERYRSSRRFLYAFAGSLLFGLMAVAGMLQYFIYSALMMGFYFLFILYRARRRKAVGREILTMSICFAITVAGGLLIAGIEILPNLDLIGNSSRIARDFTFQSYFDTLSRIPYRYFITLVFPDFFGSPPLRFGIIPGLPGQEYKNYNEWCFYMGIPALAAFLTCLAVRQSSFSRFFLLMTVLFASFLTGAYTYYPLFKLFPGMDRMNPSRMIFLLVFSLSAAAAFGIKGLGSLTATRRRIALGLIGALAAVLLAVGLLGSSPTLTAWFNREISASGPQSARLFNMLADLRRWSSPTILKPLLLGAATVVLFSLALAVKKQVRDRFVFPLLIALLGYDLISFGWGYNTMVKPELVFPQTPAIGFLTKQPGPFRVVQDSRSGLWVNSLMPFRIEEIGGYNSFYPERANALFSFIEFGPASFNGLRFDRWVTFKNLYSPLLDLMNVRYILTAPTTNLQHPKLRLVFKGDLTIYENTNALPRAFAVHRYQVRKSLPEILSYMGSPRYDMRNEVILEEEPDPSFLSRVGQSAVPPEVRINRYADDEISLTATLSGNGWLVLTDTFYPGWTARVDGKEAAILRANCNYRALPLTAGRHAVEFVFAPAFLARGWAMTLIGLFATTVGAVYLGFFRRGLNKGAEAHDP